VKNLDKARASGKHYGSHTDLPVVVGVDGVGVLSDGRRVYAHGITGMIAQYALIPADDLVVVPESVTDEVAAALPNAVIGAALALQYRAGMQPGKTVLINGATGVTGMMAVQLARIMGAHRIIATGRNAGLLQKTVALGAHETISLLDSDDDVRSRIKALHAECHIDIVIDYVWGHPAELVLQALKAVGLHHFSKTTRFVTVGGMAGDAAQVSSALLRSTAVEICGSGFGSLPQEAFAAMNRHMLPEMMQWAADGKLVIDTDVFPLANVQDAWQRNDNNGRRVVIAIP
jgi:NADPH:quinone reductase-like Zn-dependent oxidoreductase